MPDETFISSVKGSPWGLLKMANEVCLFVLFNPLCSQCSGSTVTAQKIRVGVFSSLGSALWRFNPLKTVGDTAYREIKDLGPNYAVYLHRLSFGSQNTVAYDTKKAVFSLYSSSVNNTVSARGKGSGERKELPSQVARPLPRDKVHTYKPAKCLTLKKELSPPCLNTCKHKVLFIEGGEKEQPNIGSFGKNGPCVRCTKITYTHTHTHTSIHFHAFVCDPTLHNNFHQAKHQTAKNNEKNKTQLKK